MMDLEEERIPPLHPGEVLMEEFLKPMRVTQVRLAKDINVPVSRIRDIAKGKQSITADTALRLSRYFGTTARFWMNLQASYDLAVEEDRLADRIEREVRICECASGL